MRIFLVIILAFSAGAQQERCGIDAPECILECNNRGTCCVGQVDTTNLPKNPDGTLLDVHEQTSVDGQYCNCNDGWTGVECGSSFYYCDNDANACYNNGVCTEGTLPTGETVYLCDCRNAKDDAGINYVGLYCEQAVPQVGAPDVDGDFSVVCNEDGSEFCLNGGECGTPDDDNFLVSGCTCSSEFTGLHCELYYDPTQNCTRECLNGGECALGYRNKTQPEGWLDPETADANDYAQYQHCNCAHGFSGPYCETPHDPCGADDDAQVHCFNGGTCVAPTDQNGLDSFGCDCSTAKNLTHSFSGLYCQTPSSEFCPPSPSGEGSSFCVNNGTCTEVGFEIFGCKCPDGYEGASCEFRPDTIPLLPKDLFICETVCENGGYCREGGKDFGIFDDFNGVDHMFNATYTPDFEHCICPEGYTGLLCEITVDICPNGTHVCFHGGECVPFGDEWHCNCNTSEALAAGPLCQHLATSTCSESESTAPFCVNDGICQQDGYCFCQDGFRGDQCEIVEQNDDDQFPSVQQVLPDDYQSSSNLNVTVFTGIAAFIAISIIVVTVAITYMNQVVVDSGMPHAPPQSAFARSINDNGASDVQLQESFVSDAQGHSDADTPEII